MQARKKAIALAISCAAIFQFTAIETYASSHREAPAITERPKLDSTDFYAFNSYEPGREDYVTLLANYIPLQDPQGGPNYFSMDPNALYEIHIDNDGDAIQDISFQFRFKNKLTNNGKGIQVPVGEGENQKSISIPLKHAGGIAAGNDANLGFRESYRVDVVTGSNQQYGYRQRQHLRNATTGSRTFNKPYDNVGNKTFSSDSDYASYASQFVYDVELPDCDLPGRVFVGQRKESFAVNLGETFDLVNYVPIESSAFPGGIEQDSANNDLRGKNITTLALEAPASCLTGDGNGVIGAWTSASLRQIEIINPRPSFKYPHIRGGAWTQVSRMGAPLVNELVIGLKDKDRFSGSHPHHDGQFLDYVTHPSLPVLLNVLFKDAVNATLGTSIADLAPTNIPRQDLVTAFLTGFPGLNQQSDVTPSEMLRLNTGIAATSLTDQKPLGVVADDLAGFPNGRRPGDDVVDIALRVVMGGLCHPVTLGGVITDLGLCTPEQAAVGNVPFTDGAPISAADFDNGFPYLTTPIAGSPN